ncbi:MAG: MotA/TolQ/ExbB proton channel family protein [Calditrichia bacterium]|nr:MotA/TolQ/ExbB proton channel family protein [Calditrichota bacterium]MCB0271059.1 MotA/TolQ/ExbB proton channel family protein [Calditrichota bacterium]MCB9067288.1 MotA/TolQ/ExbB proton channel family protein [Calditrichia bacterium]
MFDKHIISLILNSSIFAKIILGTLLLLSLIAWSIFLQKLAQMGAVIRSLRNNADKKSSNNTAEASNQTMVFPQNKVTIPLIQQGETALKSAVSALRKSADYLGGLQPDTLERMVREVDPMFRDELKQRLDIAVEKEVGQIANGISFLGTTITISPFLGLLGTVWGVMDAFLSIGMKGSADLATVAPGIAEALITTIAGLAVAIPAVFCYNRLNNRLQLVEDEMHHLSGEINIYFGQRWFHEKTKIQHAIRNKRDIVS